MDTLRNCQLAETCLFDKAEALARLDGDQELLQELASIFLSESPEILERLRSAVERGDAHAVAAEAHSMKGSVANFCVSSATEAALAIERMGSEKNLSSAPAAVRHLENILEGIRPGLAHLAEQTASG